MLNYYMFSSVMIFVLQSGILSSTRFIFCVSNSTLLTNVIITACPPISYRATCHAFRSAILIESDILQKMVTLLSLPQYFRALCDQHNRREFILISKSRRWTVEYANRFFTIVGWKSFVNAHELLTYHTFVLNPNVHIELHTMVLDPNNCEQIYSWY
ncbi:hypothetical protein RHMOL_Rhmol10G0221300 [Rhododendron molle]|uniref:Uncharacterized protein n=1 Tax=Rhododendron molle TaxID=49168 RepID=A0ACC0M4R6_RHOML|nr:hypothetical protein RHMOL_Rhmol10G0221300 [Rhododendron molle]